MGGDDFCLGNTVLYRDRDLQIKRRGYGLFLFVHDHRFVALLLSDQPPEQPLWCKSYFSCIDACQCDFSLSPGGYWAEIPLPLAAQGIIWVMLQAAASSGIQVLTGVLVAEIANEDTARGSEHREGSYYSVMGLLDQVSAGIASALIPLFLLLGRNEFDPRAIGRPLIGRDRRRPFAGCVAGVQKP